MSLPANPAKTPPAVEIHLSADASSRQAADAGPVAGIWMWDVVADRFTADARFAQAFDFDAAALEAGVPPADVFRPIHPDDAAAVRRLVERALAVGGAYHAEYRVLHRDGRYRWVEAVGTVALDGDGRALSFPGVLLDIESRKQSELRTTALLELGDRLRELDDAASIAATAARICGQALAVGRAAYGVVDASGEGVDFAHDWRDGERMPSLAGRYRFADFGSFLGEMQRGELVAIADVAVDPRTVSQAPAFEALGMRALLNVPLMRDDRLAGVFTLHHDAPRIWFAEEIDFVRSVADRTWAATATAQALADLRGVNSTLEREVEQRTADRNALWQLSADVMLRATFEGEIVATNPAWRDVLGWRPDEIVGRNLFDFVHPDDIERTKGGAAVLASGGGLAAFDNRYRHRDGSYRWLSWSARPGQGLINAVGRDITVERTQALELHDLEDFSRLALSAVGGVGVWRFDVATDRFFCDENIARLYAIDPVAGEAGILREGFLANVVAEDIPALRATMAGGLVNSGDLELEYRIRHPDGSVRWVLSRGHTYFDDAGKPLRRTGVGVDMTKQRLLEEQLRQSQKLEAIGQLTGGIAHDFNNMLSSISTSMQLLRRRIAVATPAEIERYFGMSDRAVRSAASLTHRLLAFSRKQPLDIRAVDASRLARDMEELLRRTLGEQIELKLSLAEAPWLARTDSHQLENALLNLAINARDAMPAGGVLSIVTDNLDVRRGDVRADLQPGGYVLVAVSDTGTGMPPEVVRRAFDPFFTTKPIGQGTGLGLSMIYGFVKQSGGHVAIESALGAGTTVRMYLPRSAMLDDDKGLQQPVGSAPHGNGEHVLVVEDEPDVRQVVLEALTEFGYRTSSAPNAPAALQLLSSDKQFDLLLTDVGLPGMSGRELADQARLQHPRLKVLFMTGYAKGASVRAEFLGEGMDMLAKPFEIDDLARRVFSMTRRDAY